MRYALTIIAIIIFALIALNCFGGEYPPIWKVLLTEAADQGYDGMYAVACVIKNRDGSLRGFAGAKRQDLDSWIKKNTARRHRKMAQDIENKVFNSDKFVDTTGGATHFENIEAYGVPYWAKEMTITCKIGNHTFYKRAK